MEKSTGKHVLYDLIYQKPQARQNETLYCLWIPKDEANDKEKQGEENSTARLTVSEKVAGRQDGCGGAVQGTSEVTTTYFSSRTGW